MSFDYSQVVNAMKEVYENAPRWKSLKKNMKDVPFDAIEDEIKNCIDWAKRRNTVVEWANIRVLPKIKDGKDCFAIQVLETYKPRKVFKEFIKEAH